MVRIRCGFYITDKFPKSEVPFEGEEVLKIPDDAIVFYDVGELASSSDEELIRYCEELIEHHGLDWEPEELKETILMCAFIKEHFSLGIDHVKSLPNVEIVKEDPSLH